MRAAFAFAAVLGIATTVEAQDGPTAQAMAQTCYVCHGPQGRSGEVSAIDTNAGTVRIGDTRLPYDRLVVSRSWYKNICADTWG